MSEKKAKEQRKEKIQQEGQQQAQKAEISIVVYPPLIPGGESRMEVKHPQNLALTINMLLDTLRLMYKQIIQVQEKPKIISLKPGATLPKVLNRKPI